MDEMRNEEVWSRIDVRGKCVIYWIEKFQCYLDMWNVCAWSSSLKNYTKRYRRNGGRPCSRRLDRVKITYNERSLELRDTVVKSVD